MSDIFISHAKDDWPKAAKLAAVFIGQSWTISFDLHEYVPGGPTREQELKRAKVIVGLWSRAARGGGAVLRAFKHLTPALPVLVLTEKIAPPAELMVARSFDLSDWDGEAEHEGLTSLLRHLRALIAASSLPAAPREVSDGLPKYSVIRDLFKQQEESADSPSEGDTRFKGVFISYRRNEAAAYAGRFYDRLVARFGRERVFLDVENVGAGEDFVDAITAAAESCAVMVVLISRQWARGEDEQTGQPDYVRLEVATALGRKIRVIPITIQGAFMPAPKDLPEDLLPILRRNAPALSDARWERDVEDLIKTLEKLLKG